MRQRKMMIFLICGMLGCVLMCTGDWLMMYGETAYHGDIYWLTEGVAQISAERNSLSMFVAFPAIVLYGIALFATGKFVKQENLPLSYGIWADPMAVFSICSTS